MTVKLNRSLKLNRNLSEFESEPKAKEKPELPPPRRVIGASTVPVVVGGSSSNAYTGDSYDYDDDDDWDAEDKDQDEGRKRRSRPVRIATTRAISTSHPLTPRMSLTFKKYFYKIL